MSLFDVSVDATLSIVLGMGMMIEWFMINHKDNDNKVVQRGGKQGVTRNILLCNNQIQDGGWWASARTREEENEEQQDLCNNQLERRETRDVNKDNEVQRNQLVEVDAPLWQVNHLHGMKMMTRNDNNEKG
jgi:hypothetical protein